MPIYVGTFIIAFATLALQIALTRLLSITTWYHVAFFAIGAAMLGMTIGAVRVFCAPERFAKINLLRNLMLGSIGFAFSTPITLAVLCLTPVGANIFTPESMLALSLITLACLLPYYFAGIVVTLVLTRCTLPVGKVYAADLLGASLGCLFVLASMEVLDPSSLVIACAGVGALAASAFLWNDKRGLALRWLILPLVLLAGAAINTRSISYIRPMVVKGTVQPVSAYAFERSNSFSQVFGTHIESDRPQLWGASPKLPPQKINQFVMVIDGAAGTTAREFKTPADLEHLRYDVTNAAYHLRPNGGACIIGVGGGRDLQTALLFGHQDVLGVEVNPIFVDLIQKDYRSFLGLADRPAVRLQVDDARAYLSHSKESFSLLQMSLIDTWAATGAGAFSLSENTLYTVEAWDVFFSRLKPDGIFTVSRWYNPKNLGELGRLLSLAVTTLLKRGVEDPAAHLAVIHLRNVATLMVGARPFTPEEIDRLEQVCLEYEFHPIALPGRKVENPVLAQILAARSPADLVTLANFNHLRLESPTDESPYFFNMLRFRSLFEQERFIFTSGVLSGNMRATQTLAALVLMLLLATFCTVFIPLWLRPRSIEGTANAPVLWSGAIYFSLIGAGFMLVEIALVQRLSVLLSHPTYALGILLFTLISSTGIGSFLSERLPLTRAPWVYLYPLLVAGMILFTSELVKWIVRRYITADLSMKVAASIVVIFPLGVTLGLCFPTGMRLVRAARPGETPWYWALNGVFGVLCSTIAVGISIFAWISLNFYLAAACYAVVALAAAKIHSHLGTENPAEAVPDTAA